MKYPEEVITEVLDIYTNNLSIDVGLGKVMHEISLLQNALHNFYDEI